MIPAGVQITPLDRESVEFRVQEKIKRDFPSFLSSISTPHTVGWFFSSRDQVNNFYHRIARCITDQESACIIPYKRDPIMYQLALQKTTSLDEVYSRIEPLLSAAMDMT